MDATTLARSIDILENDPEIYLPVERLWLTLRTEGLAMDLDRESFQRELEADSRFDFTAPPVLLSADETASFGLAAGPHVKLSSRQVTTDAVLDILEHNVDQLHEVLLRAWENRPLGDDRAEAMLVEAMAKAEKLRSEIRDVIRIRRPPPEETVP
ncbi:MAG TPA: hypothetical protein VJJ46_00215 [Anaerolineales bacterium]|nr:hypothetical protein [Anaerolineales bacterium]